MRLLVRWLINAVSLIIVANIVPGFELHGFMAALIAALVFGFVNATLGLLLKILTFPLTIVTFGLFLIVINAISSRWPHRLLQDLLSIPGWQHSKARLC